MSYSSENDRRFQENLFIEMEQDFADVAYQFYQLFSKKYPDFPFPNALDFSEVAACFDPRKKGSLEHGQGERINDPEFQQLVFDMADKLGFVRKEVVSPRNEMERKLEIYSNPSRYIGNIEAIVVTGGAGQTLIKRTYHALEAIRLGRVMTRKIFLLTGHRDVSARENDLLMKNGFSLGQTEFELAQGAVTDLIPSGLKNLRKERQKVVLGGGNYWMNLISGDCLIGQNVMNITILDCPFDKKRTLADGSLANRAITEETFSCLGQLLGNFDTKTLYLVSHDIYQPAQMLFAQEVLGKQNGRTIVGSGPVNTDRIIINSSGELELTGHGAVLSEINKYFNVANRFYNVLKSEVKESLLY